MCAICGCGNSEQPGPKIFHQHRPGQPGLLQPMAQHQHQHAHEAERLIRVEQDLLAKNAAYAAQNRRYFEQRNIFALNLVSSPGAGKTTLLEATIKALRNRVPVAVIEGDQQTDHDAARIRAAGAPALQINTGKACHLDAHGIGHALEALQVQENSLLAIENVGNLVCPAAFDLGEAHKVVVLSVTEGDDKPLKYPDMFHAADLMIVNKIDLLPYVEFDVERCIEYAHRIKPDIEVLRLSATKGDGLAAWTAWIEQRIAAPRG